MNYYEIMFLGFIIIYISEWASIIWEISSDAVPLRKTRALVHRRRREGAGVLLEITVGGVQHASWKPNPASNQNT